MQEKLAGLWLLESWEARFSPDDAFKPYGPAPKGRLYYGADGQVMVQMASSERRPFASEDLHSATDAEVRMAYTGFSAYFGRYSVDIDRREITHHIQGCWLPNWEGTDLRRYFSLHGSKLVLSTDPMQSSLAELDAARHVLTWLRI